MGFCMFYKIKLIRESKTSELQKKRATFCFSTVTGSSLIEISLYTVGANSAHF